MRLFLSICFLTILSFHLSAQQPYSYRSDTLNFSFQIRYLFLSYGAGVEFPFKQHSFGLQYGRNYLPPEGNWTIGFNTITVTAAEYKRYFSTKPGANNQFYYGSHLLLKQIDYESPEEGKWEGNWYNSESLSIGPLFGWKAYGGGRRAYFEFFLGMHGGWQWGNLRWVHEDPSTGSGNPSYQSASKRVWGMRAGISVGIHPFKKNVKRTKTTE